MFSTEVQWALDKTLVLHDCPVHCNIFGIPAPTHKIPDTLPNLCNNHTDPHVFPNASFSESKVRMSLKKKKRRWGGKRLVVKSLKKTSLYVGKCGLDHSSSYLQLPHLGNIIIPQRITLLLKEKYKRMLRSTWIIKHVLFLHLRQK